MKNRRPKCIICDNKNAEFESITPDTNNYAWPLCNMHSHERCRLTVSEFVARYKLGDIMLKMGFELEFGQWIMPPSSELFKKAKDNPIVKIFKK